VAFYLVAALRTHLQAQGWPAGQQFDPREVIDLVAVGTVADMVPLIHENRILAAVGLWRLSRSPRPGLAALCELAGLSLDSPVGAPDVAFRIGPRLNAPGRLGDARPALDILLATDDAEARPLAATCHERNRERQQIQERVYKEAVIDVDSGYGGSSGIVVGRQGWHPGVVGIVAAKLVETYGRPAVVVGLAGERGRGSARSVPGFDVYQALARCAPLLERYGGHSQAAGITVATSRMEELAAAFDEVVRESLGSAPPQWPLPADLEVDLAAVGDLAGDVARLAPFGVGNPEPLFISRPVTASHSRVVGDDHLLLRLRQGSVEREAIGFHMADLEPERGARLEIAYHIETSVYRGEPRLRLRLRGLERLT
jgi:single-stranded-DNA-specific exonuclease